MKRITAFFLCLLMTITLIGCGDDASSKKKNTIMIYMVGSDLEAKGGAGTNDLDEMVKSGVDLSKTNVLVYAGGSKKWHNDKVSSKTEHSLLKLTKSGFKRETTMLDASMGDSESLSGFLNYAYKNFPADNFSLILWDHGDGPLIGYGKDMLHDNDSLTLAEMSTALKASPFGKKKKLSWVGFDACLMSSAELACIWSDYAEYLVASQEIEPAFGWDYAFLSKIGKDKTASLLKGLTQTYLSSCEKYYEKKGYDDRDTTLACVDLSKIGEIRTAIGSLFKKAVEDIDDNYNLLTSSRVDTRALGRASTGSEYDLIDLNDMASQLEDMYPQEAKALQNAISKAVIANSTNTQGCCGMSIYYPFYNKTYYEKEWGEVYSKLGVLPEYAKYLEAYADVWLGDDLLKTVAKSSVPKSMTKNEFVLELTDEQADSYAHGGYYILQREGDQLYTRIFSAQDVTKNGNRLTANFDGQILYAKNKFDEYWIPVATEHDTVGDITRYSVYVNLTNNLPIMGENPEGYEHKVQGYRFHLAANNETKEIKKSALIPYDVSTDAGALLGGKMVDADLSEWSQYYFLHERHRYLDRYENGVIKPVDQWEASAYYSASVSNVGDELDFLFAPIPDGEYYLAFEVEDTQGNRYCSELLPIHQSGNTIEKTFVGEDIELSWDNGKEVKLFDKENVVAYLTTIEDTEGTRYALKVKNNNDFDIAVLGGELGYNDKVYCPDGTYAYFSVPAGKTVTDDGGFSFGDAEDLKLAGDLSSLQFGIEVQTLKGDKTIIYDQYISVELSSETTFIPPVSFLSDGYYDYNMPTRGALATQQVVFDRNGLKGTLIGFGGNGTENGNLVAAFCFENNSDELRHFAIEGFVIDGIYVEEQTGPITVLPHTVIYKALILTDTDMERFSITSPSSLMLQLKFMKFATLEGGGGFAEAAWYPVTLAQRGSGSNLAEGSTVLYNEKGVRITLNKTVKPDKDSYALQYEWYCTVVNTSGSDIKISADNVTVNGEKVDLNSFNSNVLISYGTCGNGQKTVFRICCDVKKANDTVELAFNPVFFDIVAEKELWRGTQSIKLNGK